MFKRINTPSLFLYLSAFEALLTAIYLLTLPGDPKNSILLGYSLIRIVMILAMLAAAAAALYPGIRINRIDERIKTWFIWLAASRTKYRVWVGIGFLLLLTGWGLTFLPSYRLGDYAAYLDRARPLLAWFTVNILQGLIVVALMVRQSRIAPADTDSGRLEPSNRTAIFIFGGILATILYMALTRIGLKPDQMLWNEPGVPLLGLQVIFAAGICFLGYLFVPVVNNGKHQKITDILIFLAICAAAALVLSVTPASRTYFSPGPYPPNLEVYPFSDAAGYDISAQYALLGQGFGNFKEVDKPLFSFFIFLLHLLAGENYNQILALQAAVLAVFPALLFWLTKRMFTRAAGLTIAFLLVIKELNSYGAGIFIQVSHSKLFLGELPLAVVLMLFTYFVVRWFSGGKHAVTSAMAAGGLLGLATLLRHNPWLLVPVVLLAAAFRFRWEWKTGLKTCLLFSGVMGLAILPWMLRSSSVQDNPLYFFGPLKGVVWTGRYLPAVKPTIKPVQMTEIPGSILTVTPFPTTATPIANGAPTTESTPNAPAWESLKSRTGTFAGFVSSHFFHNLAATALILPHCLVLDDLQRTLQAGGSAWSSGWAGSLGTVDLLLLAISLGIVALGIAAAWKKTGMAGIMPLVIFAGYSLATAAARTSGGRYLVPVDWVVILYFGIGLTAAINRMANALGLKHKIDIPDKSEDQAIPSYPGWKKMLLVAIVFLGIGSAIPLSELAVKKKYTEESLRLSILQINRDGTLKAEGISADQLEKFIVEKQALVGYGRLLYPRYYAMDEGEPDIYSANKSLPFPRLVFKVAGLRSGSFVLPMLEKPDPIPPGSSVLVLSCRKNRWYTDALQLIILEPEGKVLSRSPGSALKCPAVPPVCDNNGNCN